MPAGSVVLIVFSVISALGGLTAITFFVIKRYRRKGYEKISTTEDIY